MKKRCIWSNKKGDQLIQIEVPVLSRLGKVTGKKCVFIHPEFQKSVQNYYKSQQQFIGVFYLLTGLSVLVSTLGFFLLITGVVNARSFLLTISGSMLCLGLVISLFPFVTDQTIDLFGIKQGRHIARISGIILVLIGIIMMNLHPPQ